MNNNQDTKDIFREILKWTKFQGMERVKRIQKTALDNDIKKIIYEASDGKSSYEIARIAGVSDQTVRNYWKEWAVLGLTEIHPEYKKRYRKFFSLIELGIVAPENQTTNESEQE